MSKINDFLKKLNSKQWVFNWFCFAFFVCAIAALVFINRSLAVNTAVSYQLTEHVQRLEQRAAALERQASRLEARVAELSAAAN